MFFVVAAAVRKWSTGPVPGVRWLKSTGPPQDSRHTSRNHVRHSENRPGKLLPVCGRHIGKLLKLTGGMLDSPGGGSKKTEAIAIQAGITIPASKTGIAYRPVNTGW